MPNGKLPSFDLGKKSVTDEPLWEASFEDSEEWLVEQQDPDDSEVWSAGVPG